jgi:alkyl sulfatase BDS1-like metallo-beta-lactamase superfamily hydrolase
MLPHGDLEDDMTNLRDFCETLWQGAIDTAQEAHPVTTPYMMRQGEEIAEGVLYYKGFASATTFDTGDGLLMLDTGGRNDAAPLYQAVRSWRPDTPLRAAVFSHHHVDHVFGVGPFDEEARQGKAPPPLVYGHAAIPSHFERYRKTRGWNGAINRRQFTAPDNVPLDRPTPWPDDFRAPDVAYHDRLVVRCGRLTFELNHCRGETEDNTWTWVPELGILAPGDLFVWSVPNAGNPQKVQRWVGEWAAGLRRMAALDAETMVPGHGWPIFGRERVRAALLDTAAFLEDIESQVLALMNSGASLDTVLHAVKLDEEAMRKPYLRPVYDHPQFLIRNVWRLYGGWYDGEPDNLLPAPRADQAREWVALAGGLGNVLSRVRRLLGAGDARLASHLIEYAVLAEPASREAHELRAAVYEARAAAETSSMARNIFSFAAGSSRLGKRDAFARE